MREVRLENLRGLVESRGTIEVEAASEHLGVSRETIRRDLSELAKQGYIRRTRGGAAALGLSLTERDLEQRQLSSGPEKAEIARYVVDRFVEDEMSIALDGGTTALEIAKRITGRRVTVVTASIPIVVELSRSATSVIVIGGELRSKSMTAGGAYATSMMEQFHTDCAFVSGPAISTSGGLMDSYAEGVALKRSMIANAARAYAVLDSSKIGGRSFVSVCELDELDGVVTDHNVTADQLAEFDSSSTPIFIAE
jgi:Transcriptional regulators of sugar metabolism